MWNLSVLTQQSGIRCYTFLSGATESGETKSRQESEQDVTKNTEGAESLRSVRNPRYDSPLNPPMLGELC